MPCPGLTFSQPDLALEGGSTHARAGTVARKLPLAPCLPMLRHVSACRGDSSPLPKPCSEVAAHRSRLRGRQSNQRALQRRARSVASPHKSRAVSDERQAWAESIALRSTWPPCEISGPGVGKRDDKAVTSATMPGRPLRALTPRGESRQMIVEGWGTPRSSRGCTRSTGTSLASPRSCPLCCSVLRPSMIEDLGCGVHMCCTDCATKALRSQVRGGHMPCCFHPDCRAEADPLVIKRLLGEPDYDLYLRLALWSNPSVEVCPRCCSMVYVDAGGNNSNGICPECRHSFCLDCRCPTHTGELCEEALQREATHQCDPAEERKVCPRCRAWVEKADESACDHMTCARCSHEFCWKCLADRAVIYAHGNHHHRPNCPYFAPYAGPEEFLPGRCPRCTLRRTPCRPLVQMGHGATGHLDRLGQYLYAAYAAADRILSLPLGNCGLAHRGDL